MELLHIIQRRKLVRRDHLEIISPEYRYLKDRTRTLNKSLSKLFQRMCIDKYHEEMEYMAGDSPAIIALDRAGTILLSRYLNKDLRHSKKIDHIKKIYGNKTYYIRKLAVPFAHIHGVNQLEFETINLCEEIGANLLVWNLEYENYRKYGADQEAGIKPDVFMIIRVDNKPFVAYIEYDNGTEDKHQTKSIPYLTDKLKKYRMYMLSKEWGRENWFDLYPHFPPIIFVVQTKQRVGVLEEKAKELKLNLIAITKDNYQHMLREGLDALLSNSFI